METKGESRNVNLSPGDLVTLLVIFGAEPLD